MKQRKATKIVSGAIAGLDSETVLINGKVYIIDPPTIHKISGAGYYLSDIGDYQTISDVINDMKNFSSYAHALSWFIKGDDSLVDEFMNAPFNDVSEAIGVAFTMLPPENFIKLSALARNVQQLIAKPK